MGEEALMEKLNGSCCAPGRGAFAPAAPSATRPADDAAETESAESS